MTDRVVIASDRIVRTNTEGFRPDVYDDNTGLRLTLSGQPTIGYGCRCRGWSEPFALAVLKLQLSEHDAVLGALPWYTSLDDVRASVVLEAAFNLGDNGLLNGYPHFVTAMERRDLPSAATELHVRQAGVDSGRYERLRRILQTGIDE